MQFDDIAKVIGYLTIASWIATIVLVLIIMVMGKSTTVKEKLVATFARDATPSARKLGPMPAPIMEQRTSRTRAVRW